MPNLRKQLTSLEIIQQPIKTELEQFNALFTSSLSIGNGMLKTALDYVIRRKGKQMRPILMLLAGKACGEVSLKCLHAACALEMLHTASLVHDDVVDESPLRRGVPSMNAFLSNQAAVLVGDFLLSKALEHSVMTRNQRVMKVVAQLGQTLAQGELEQLDNLSSEDFGEASYYDVIRKKTASLFSACAELGAMLCGGSKGDVVRFKGLGTLVGICFQLRDDILDYIAGDGVGENTLGKPVGQDLREGKLTLPVLHLAQAHPEYREKLLTIRKGMASDDDIREIVRLTVENDGIVYAEKTMGDFCNMTMGLLTDVQNAEVRKSLNEYVSFVAGRKW